MLRRHFLQRFLAALGGIFFLSRCSESTSGNCTTNGTSSTISSNHGHSLTVSASDVAAGTQRTYNIQGSSGHNHTVTVTASHFASLQAGTAVTITSSSFGHTHSVAIACA